MRKILIATHSSFAKGISDSLEFMLGKQDNVSFMCAYLSNDFDIDKEIDKYLEGLRDDQQLIVLADLFGGSVATSFINRFSDNRIHVLTGVNFPMLLDVVMNSDEDIKSVVLRGLEAGKKGIVYVNELIENDFGEEEEL